MEQNVGGYDRIARTIGGFILLAIGLGAFLEFWPGGIALGVIGVIIGLVLLGTATTQKCVCNEVLDIDTTGDESRW